MSASDKSLLAEWGVSSRGSSPSGLYAPRTDIEQYTNVSFSKERRLFPSRLILKYSRNAMNIYL